MLDDFEVFDAVCTAASTAANSRCFSVILPRTDKQPLCSRAQMSPRLFRLKTTQWKCPDLIFDRTSHQCRPSEWRSDAVTQCRKSWVVCHRLCRSIVLLFLPRSFLTQPSQDLTSSFVCPNCLHCEVSFTHSLSCLSESVTTVSIVWCPSLILCPVCLSLSQLSPLWGVLHSFSVLSVWVCHNCLHCEVSFTHSLSCLSESVTTVSIVRCPSLILCPVCLSLSQLSPLWGVLHSFSVLSVWVCHNCLHCVVSFTHSLSCLSESVTTVSIVRCPSLILCPVCLSLSQLSPLWVVLHSVSVLSVWVCHNCLHCEVSFTHSLSCLSESVPTTFIVRCPSLILCPVCLSLSQLSPLWGVLHSFSVLSVWVCPNYIHCEVSFTHSLSCLSEFVPTTFIVRCPSLILCPVCLSLSQLSPLWGVLHSFSVLSVWVCPNCPSLSLCPVVSQCWCLS